MINYLFDWKTNKSNKNKKKYFFIGHNDPVILNGKVIDQRIKGTLGITG